MGETIADMNKGLEEKDKKISFLETKIGIADDKIVEEMNKLIWKKNQIRKKWQNYE